MEKGYFLVFNDFTREFSENDVELIRETAEDMEVQCDIVELIPNEESECIKNAYISFEEKLKTASFVLVFYMAHNQPNGRNSEFTYIKKTLFTPLIKTRELDGKLKWLILQTCRGYKYLKPVTHDGVPRYFLNYYLMSFPTCEGAKAYRKENGCPYITAICNRLKTHRNEKSLKQMLDAIAEEDKEQEYTSENNFPNKDFCFRTKSFFDVN